MNNNTGVLKKSNRLTTSVACMSNTFVLNFDAMKYGQRLRLARKHKKWSQERLSEKSGVPQGSISKIERGDQEYSSYDVDLAMALDIHPKWLGDGNEEFAPGWLNPANNVRSPGLDKLIKSINTSNKSISETEEYWHQTMQMCNKLIDDGFYQDDEKVRRDLYHEAVNIAGEYHYPDLSIIENLLRNKSAKKSNNTENHL